MNQFVDLKSAPIGGVNVTDSENSIEDTEASDSRNFLYENKQALTRPGMRDFATQVDSPIIYAKGNEADIFGNVFITAAGDIWRRWVDGTTQKYTVTGGPTTFGPQQWHNMAKVNGVMLIANNFGGIIRWQFGSNPTVMPDAPYIYVTGHYSRAFAALQPGSLDGILKVAWSVPGDESVWVAPPNTINGSGSAVLADAPDFITQLGVIKNVVVIYRNNGIHLGYANSSNSPAYSFQTWSRDQIGLTHSSSFASSRNLHFFIGQDEVRMFDLNEVTNIGYKIRKKLQPFIEAGVPILGFCTTHSFNGRYVNSKLRYHLLPLTYYGETVPVGGNFPPAFVNCPTLHFVYSVEDNNWSIHDYNFMPTAGMDLMGDPVGLRNPYSTGCCLFDAAAGVTGHLWDDSLPPERCSYLQGKQWIAEAPEKDYTLQRVLVRLRDFGAVDATVTAKARLNNTVKSFSKVKSVGANNDGYWVRSWFDMLGDGTPLGTAQDFLPRIDIPANQRFALDYLSMRVTESGEFRG